MQDILEGGILVSISPWRRTHRRKISAARSRQAGHHHRSAPRRNVAVPHEITVQPGQLSSPLLKSGFPSLALH